MGNSGREGPDDQAGCGADGVDAVRNRLAEVSTASDRLGLALRTLADELSESVPSLRGKPRRQRLAAVAALLGFGDQLLAQLATLSGASSQVLEAIAASADPKAWLQGQVRNVE
jgi:hypothetical protein